MHLNQVPTWNYLSFWCGANNWMISTETIIVMLCFVVGFVLCHLVIAPVCISKKHLHVTKWQKGNNMAAWKFEINQWLRSLVRRELSYLQTVIQSPFCCIKHLWNTKTSNFISFLLQKRAMHNVIIATVIYLRVKIYMLLSRMIYRAKGISMVVKK